MKKLIGFIAICVLLLACSKDNLYELDFEDLTLNRDFIYKIEFYPIDKTKTITYRVIKYQTNGYGEEVNQSILVVTRPNSDNSIFEAAVKEYKMTGVDIYPIDNVKLFRIFLYEVGANTNATIGDPVFYQLAETSQPIMVRYDFETDELVIGNLEED